MAKVQHLDKGHLYENGKSLLPSMDLQTAAKTDKSKCGCLAIRQWSKEKKLTTLCLFMEMTVWGMFIGMMNSSMLDLELLTNTSTTQISLIWTAYTVGSVFMGPIAGFLLDKSDSRLYLGVCQVCCGVLTACLPLSGSFTQIMAVAAAMGIFLGLLDIGRNITAVKLWGWDGAMWLQLYHFIFAIGSAVSPLFTRPFLAMPTNGISGNDTEFDLTGDNGNGTPSLVLNISETKYTESRIHIPFAIVGGLGILSGLIAVLVFLAIRQLKVKVGQVKKEALEIQTKKQEGWYVVLMVIFLFLRFFFAVGIEVTLGALQMTFLVKGLGWRKSDAVMAVFTLRVTFAAMRGIGVGLATFMTPTKLMFMDIGLLTTSFSLLWISKLYPAARWIVWISTCLAGCGIATFYSASMSWAEKYLRISGRVGGFFLIGSAVGVLAFPPLGGYLFETYTPWSFVYMLLSVTVLLFLTTILSAIIGNKYRKRHPNETNIELPEIDPLKQGI